MLNMRSTSIRLLLSACLFGPALAVGQWIDRQGNRIQETQGIKSEGDFGVRIVLTPSEQRFCDTWDRSSTSPRLESTNSVRRGQKVSAMILFHGCSANAKGQCDAIVRFALVSPDGKATPAGEGPLWTKAPARGMILLSHASLTLGFDQSDRVGNYQVVATVIDRIAGKQIEVSAPLAVQ